MAIVNVLKVEAKEEVKVLDTIVSPTRVYAPARRYRKLRQRKIAFVAPWVTAMPRAPAAPYRFSFLSATCGV